MPRLPHHSFNKYLWTPYDVPDTVLSVWDTPVNDASKIPGLLQPALGEVGGQKINSSIKNK